MRERRSRAGLVVAAAVALVAVGGLLGRLTAPTAEPRPIGSGSLPAPPPAHGARTIAGVPVGYARTREGAVAAMATYGQALADPRVQLDDRRRGQVAAAVGTERYARSLDDAKAVFAARRGGAVGEALRPGARAVFLGVPVAYRIASYDGDHAVVVSWGVAITASDTGLQPRASWGITTTTAVWQHGDWKVDRVVGRPGPVPAGAGTPSSPGPFIDSLLGMRPLHHAP